MSVELTFNGTDVKLLEFLRSRYRQVLASMKKEMTNQMDLLVSYVVNEKLQGQVLISHSNTLARSVRRGPITVDESRVTGKVLAGGGEAPYAEVQEKGGTKEYEIAPVNKKALAFLPSAYNSTTVLAGGGVSRQVIRQLQRGVGSVRERAISKFSEAGGVVVRKVIHPPLIARPFMAPSLEEKTEQITEGLRRSIIRGLKGS